MSGTGKADAEDRLSAEKKDDMKREDEF